MSWGPGPRAPVAPASMASTWPPLMARVPPAAAAHLELRAGRDDRPAVAREGARVEHRAAGHGARAATREGARVEAQGGQAAVALEVQGAAREVARGDVVGGASRAPPGSRSR